MTTPPLNAVLRQARRLATEDTASAQADRRLLARFAQFRDEEAFEALLSRHGPLVWGVCRRVLPGRADAEDVFQAVFLALTRKAASLHTPDSLGGWLYSVARRIALRVRAGNARRSACEAQAPPRQGADPLSELTGRELCAVLDEELGHLPEGLRAPLV